MLILVLLISIWFGCAVAHKSPYKPTIRPRQTPQPEAQMWEFVKGGFSRKFVESKCTDEQKERLKSAWEDAKLIIEAQTNIIAGYDYDLVHRTWMGDDWDARDTPEKEGWGKIIEDNFARIAGLFRGEYGKSEEFFWRYTPEPDDDLCDDGKMYANNYYNLDFHLSGNHMHTITFCPPYWSLETIGEQIARHKDDEMGQMNMVNFVATTSHIMLHEIYHIKLATQPQTIDYAIEYHEALDLARTYGMEFTHVNSDSYTHDAVAIYLQQTFKSSKPPTRLI
ncbi:Metalloproteases (zincins), catalytic [Glarea lozoyensis ATCC 20868]|uniref:Metalloproteases (Zincins), catalytic n=1 Tax=Glarea lozoyensis (strain ATCC 20868 / MF5171) TaxID=1116229 RepID=S3DYX3_GLAL2|nr:Metalloproteases (zincins), catalytic [Glarea lozoyensis ATCC 20868]EPE31553.1 Metalloproteases (zincins), catalytic [Glarea lozoyensis ATCC 20868]